MVPVPLLVPLFNHCHRISCMVFVSFSKKQRNRPAPTKFKKNNSIGQGYKYSRKTFNFVCFGNFLFDIILNIGKFNNISRNLYILCTFPFSTFFPMCLIFQKDGYLDRLQLASQIYDRQIDRIRYIQNYRTIYIYTYEVCPEGIQPYDMKNRDIYCRRYKRQETVYVGQ